VAYLIQYFQDGNLVGSATAAGPFSDVRQAAEQGLSRREADALKVFDGVRKDAVWSMQRAIR
jgi:hypothetical protein